MKPVFAEETPTEAHHRRLRILLNMSEETITANEQGYLSASQRQSMISEAKQGIVLLAICAFVMGILLANRSEDIRHPLTFIAIGMVVFVVLLAFGVIRAFSDLRHRHDVRQVMTYEGIIRRVPMKSWSGRDTTYNRYVIGKEQIHLHGPLPGVIKPGQPYRLYSTIDGKRIIGAQLISELPADTERGR